jgi:hypothetical protein
VCAQAQQKAREIHEKLDTSNLIQNDSNLFVVKPDGSIDTNAAAKFVTEAISSLASPSNPLSEDEKHVLEEFIGGFVRVLTPSADLERVAEIFSTKMDFIEKKAAGNDQRLGSQSLVDIGSGTGIDVPALTELAEKFLQHLEQNFQVQHTSCFLHFLELHFGVRSKSLSDIGMK